MLRFGISKRQAKEDMREEGISLQLRIYSSVTKNTILVLERPIIHHVIVDTKQTFLSKIPIPTKQEVPKSRI